MAGEIENDVFAELKDQLNLFVDKRGKSKTSTHLAEVSGFGDDGITWAQISGNEEPTPVVWSGVDAAIGDQVRLEISNGAAKITENLSNPSAGIITVSEGQILVNDRMSVIENTIVADKIETDRLIAQRATIEELEAVSAEIEELDATKAYIDTLVAADVSASDLEASNAYIEALVAGSISASDISASVATVDTLDANYAKIDASNMTSACITSALIANGAVGNAQIADVSANKLTAGTINGSVINVTNLNADNITAGTLNGQRIGSGSLSLDKLAEDVYTESEVDSIVDDLNARIDAQIETWTTDTVPTLNNAPANAWTTNDLKAEHVGDICYVLNANSDYDGFTYRFAYDNHTSTYSWVLIQDNQVTAALGRIDDLETFESSASTWISNTDTELTAARGSYTTLGGRIDADETSISTKVETSTFNTLSNTVDSNSAAITQLTTTTDTLVEQSYELIEGTQTASTNIWTGVTTETALESGKRILYRLPYAGTSTAAKLNLTLAGGGATGQKSVYRYGTTTVTTQFPVNSYIPLVYNGTAWTVAGATNTDTNYYDRTAYKASVTAVGAISSARIGVFGTGTNAGKLQLLSTTAFDTTYPILYIGTAFTATALTQTNNYTFWGTAFNLTNTHAITGAAAGKPVYIVGSMTGNVMTPTSAVLTCTEPTEADGLYYIRLGLMSTAANAVLEAQHPIYAYIDGAFQQATKSVVTTSNTVNTISQTTTSNTASITALETVTTNNGLTSSTNITSRVSTVEQNLSGFQSTVSETYLTQTDAANTYATDSDLDSLEGRVSTAESNITQNATDITMKVSSNGVISAINQSSEQITINANRVNIEGAAIFTGNGRLSQTSLDASYDAAGSASAAQSAAISAAASDATSKANAAQSAAISAAASDATSKANAAQAAAEATAAADATSKANAAQAAAEATAAADATSKANAAQAAAEATAAADATSKANAAQAAAEATAAADATAKANAANAQEQLIYISKAAGTTSVSANTTWVTATSDSQNTWTVKRPTYNSSYPILFVATQRKTVGGTVTCTTPLKDDTTTVIDGGHITTGTIDASVATITNINASNITSGTLSADRVDASSLTIGQSQVTNLTTDLSNAAKRDYVSIVPTAINWSAGTATLQATLYVDGTATTSSVTYAWLKDGTAISGATSRTLSIDGTTHTLNSAYTCKVTY